MSIIGFKATNRDLTCIGYQYKPNSTFKLGKDEFVIACNSGFHFCQDLENITKYYQSLSVPRIFNVSCEHGLVENDKTITDEITFGDEFDYESGVNHKDVQISSICIANLILNGVDHNKFNEHDEYFSEPVMSAMGMLGYMYFNYEYKLFDTKKRKAAKILKSVPYANLYGLVHIKEVSDLLDFNKEYSTIAAIMSKHYTIEEYINKKREIASLKIDESFNNVDLLNHLCDDIGQSQSYKNKLYENILDKIINKTDIFNDILLSKNNKTINKLLIKNKKCIDYFKKLNSYDYNLELVNVGIIDFEFNDFDLSIIDDDECDVFYTCLYTGFKIKELHEKYKINDTTLCTQGYCDLVNPDSPKITKSAKNRYIVRQLFMKHNKKFDIRSISDDNIEYIINQLERMND